MESSVRYNETIGHANNRKLINESDIGLDSGYASTSTSAYNITETNNVSAGSPEVPSLTQTSIPRKSIDLETIAENDELSFVQTSPSVNETPTTRSIRQINAFHITTPQNTKNETTPTKSCFYTTRSVHKSSHKKSRSIGGANRSPMHQLLTASQKKSRGLSMTFKDKLKSTDNLENELFEETENNENNFSISMDDPAISPISHHNRSASTTPRSKQRVSLQRYPSGIESSTPKHGPIKRGNPQTVAKSHFMSSVAGGNLFEFPEFPEFFSVDKKCISNFSDQEDTLYKKSRLIRKTQSFSPLKRNSSVLREIPTNWQTVLERHDEQNEEEEEQLVNPARKMLTFTNNQFENLVNMKPNFQSNEGKSSVCSPKAITGLELQKSDRITNEIEPRLITRAKSRLFKHPPSILSEQTLSTAIPNDDCSTVTSSNIGPSDNVADVSLESMMESSISDKLTPSSSSLSSVRGLNDSNSDMDISVFAAQSVTPIKSESSKEHSVNYSIKSSVDLLLHSKIQIETPVGSKQSKQSIHESVQRKPMKKLKRSISLNPPKSPCATREFSSIIHPHLPCTPPKSYKRKRPSSAICDETSDNRSVAEPTAKRKLYDVCSRQIFYTDFEHLDILGHLARFNTRPAINIVLSNLCDKDLLSAYMVSRTWADIIDEDYTASARRLKSLKNRRSSKENLHQPSTSGIDEEKMHIKRKPFASRNLNDNPVCRKEKRSPPVSPSKRKFHENQKVNNFIFISNRAFDVFFRYIRF